MSFQPADFFVLRSPLLPYDDLAAWSSGLEAPGVLDDPDRLAAALAADRTRLRARLAEIVARPEVRDALYVASPDLDGSFGDWLAAPDSRRGQRVERALVRYLERMAARATPFGLFAGCAVGQIAEQTRLRLPPRAAQRRHTRLDMHYLCGLVDALERDPFVRQQLRFRPNSSLYRRGDRWHWTELTPNDERHSHRFRLREASPWLDRLIELARDGVTLDVPVGARCIAPDGLETLVEQQLLVSELQPAITGPEPIHRLIEQLEALAPGAPAALEAAAALREVRDALDRLDEAGVGAGPDQYRALTARLETLPAKVDRSKLYQAELIKASAEPETHDLALGSDVLGEIGRGIEILRRLHYPARTSLTRFREAFVSRFEGVEARREVPLVEALDAEVGLGFGPTTGHDGGVPLLEGLELPAGSADRAVRWGRRHTLLLAKLAEALAAGATEIELTDADLDRLANEESPPLPGAFSVTAAVAAPSEEALARGDFRLLMLGVAGPSGARMLGRFCHGDPGLREHVQQYVRTEEEARPGAVFAEIAHLPGPRAGNVIHRPVFRDYEITYLGASGAPLERQIPVTDLTVSVEGERIVLRSARLACEVIPRLTCAQNYFHPRTTVLYRFLAALQDQGVASGLGWDWGPLASAPFLPRVRSGRLVLARAHWRMTADEATSLGRLQGAELFQSVQQWRGRRGIPRRARLADYDNELLVDFHNALSVESFAQLVKGRDQAVLVEAFPGPDDLCVSGPEGRFFHELSVPYLGVGCQVLGDGGNAGEPAATLVPQDPSPITQHPRTFAPGSEWLYAKLYAAPSMVDSLLRRVVRPFVDQALGSGAADGWFFIRYADPDWHLRLRFHGDPVRLQAELLPLLEAVVAPLLECGEVRRLQLDTYERELERYGGPVGMPLCEAVFQADSEAVLEIVEAFDDDMLADARWKLAVAGMDVLLDGLGLSLAERLEVLRTVRDGFAREHRADQKLLRQIGDRFRSERASLEAVFDPRGVAGGPRGRAAAALPHQAERLVPVMAALRHAAGRSDLTLSLSELAPSLLHMHANRVLRSDQRRQEMMLYDFLYRLCDARAARARTAGQ